MFRAMLEACRQHLLVYIIVDDVYMTNTFVVLFQIDAGPVCFGRACFPAHEGPQ
jgi:hypothetical protein